MEVEECEWPEEPQEDEAYYQTLDALAELTKESRDHLSCILTHLSAGVHLHLQIKQRVSTWLHARRHEERPPQDGMVLVQNETLSISEGGEPPKDNSQKGKERRSGATRLKTKAPPLVRLKENKELRIATLRPFLEWAAVGYPLADEGVHSWLRQSPLCFMDTDSPVVQFLLTAMLDGNPDGVQPIFANTGDVYLTNVYNLAEVKYVANEINAENAQGCSIAQGEGATSTISRRSLI